MFFFIFLAFVTSDTSIRGDPSKKFWKESNLNFHMIPIAQNINFAPCDGFSQITSHLFGEISSILILTFIADIINSNKRSGL